MKPVPTESQQLNLFPPTPVWVVFLPLGEVRRGPFSSNHHQPSGKDTCIFNLQGKMIESDMEIIYLIKWKSGYYNHFELDNLKTLPEIKLFGIPDDYKYKVSRLGKPKKQIIRKVLFHKNK